MNFAQPEAVERAHRDALYIHYSDRTGAHAIAASGMLRPSTVIVDSVYAVAAGSRPVPGTQHASGRERSHAVVFRSHEPPSVWFPEEVIWRTATGITIDVVSVMSADEADELLDSSITIDDDGWWHHSHCRCEQCCCARRTRSWHNR